MYKIAIISQKGGTGKTTLSVNLAIASELDKKSAVVFDLDPQGSSVLWKKSRENDSPAVLSLQSVQVDRSLKIAEENGAELVIFDTAPHSQKETLEIASRADLVLIPCRPSLVDLRAVQSSVQIAHLAQKPIVAVLTQVSHRSNLTTEATDALEGSGIILAPAIGQRMAFVHAFTVGKGVQEVEPKGKASEEIQALYHFLMEKKP